MSDELRCEYEFDYKQAKPNRLAAKMQKGGRLVVLDPKWQPRLKARKP